MEAKSEYELKAEDVLKQAGVTVSVQFSHHGNMAWDDKARDIYDVTLKNSRVEYTFQFGQSLKNSGILGQKRVVPTAYDVLACVTKHDPGTHEDFCADYGYDEDSRRGLETYLAVQKEYFMIRKIFGEHVDLVQQID